MAGDADATWTAVFADANVTGTFDYTDFAADHCATGTATGLLTISADDLHSFGTYEDSPLPSPIAEVRVDIGFSWSRLGTDLQVDLRDSVVAVAVPGRGWVEVITAGFGAAVGSFLPALSAGDLPDCVFLDDRPAVTASILVAGSFTEDRRPSIPALLLPTGNTSFEFGEPNRFKVNATDPDGDPYTARIQAINDTTGQVVEFDTLLSPSGADSTGSPSEPLGPGNWRWSATAIDVRGAAGGTSPTETFTVVEVTLQTPDLFGAE